MTLSQDEKQFFQDLGFRLRKVRVEKNATQADLGARAGVSRQLIARMERGDPSVSLAKWVMVSSVLGLLDTWRHVLRVSPDPFAEYDRKQQRISELKKTRVRKK